MIDIEGEKIKGLHALKRARELSVMRASHQLRSRHLPLPGLIDTHTHVLLQGDITAADYDEQLLKQSTEYRTILATVKRGGRSNMASRRFAMWRPRARLRGC